MTDPATLEPEHRRVPLPSGVELHLVVWAAARSLGPAGAGGRTPFLLVHGLASNARLWDGVARRLAAAGHHCVAVDQRGHGRSSKPDDGYDMATVADDLAFLIAELEWERPVVAGQSWGGNVVLELAHRHPREVSAVAAVDGGFIRLQSRFPLWDDAASVLAPPRLAGTPRAEIEGWLARSAADWPEEGRQGTLANFEVRDDGTIAPWLTFDRHLLVLRGLWEHDPTALFPALEVPVLLMPVDTGAAEWTHDKEQAVAAAMTALPRGAVYWFRPAHHDVHAQRPDEVAELLLRAAADPDLWTGRSPTSG